MGRCCVKAFNAIQCEWYVVKICDNLIYVLVCSKIILANDFEDIALIISVLIQRILYYYLHVDGELAR